MDSLQRCGKIGTVRVGGWPILNINAPLCRNATQQACAHACTQQQCAFTDCAEAESCPCCCGCGVTARCGWRNPGWRRHAAETALRAPIQAHPSTVR
eukprot:14878981-Alexandrium_andersonii.AAC.2